MWASSPDFPDITEAEVDAIVAGFDDSSALAVNGLRIGGEKYMVVAGEPGEAIRGKKGSGKLPEAYFLGVGDCIVGMLMLLKFTTMPSRCLKRRLVCGLYEGLGVIMAFSMVHFVGVPLQMPTSSPPPPSPESPPPSSGGVTIKKTTTALVFGIYGEGVTGSECNVVVENLGDYLKDQGI